MNSVRNSRRNSRENLFRTLGEIPDYVPGASSVVIQIGIVEKSLEEIFGGTFNDFHRKTEREKLKKKKHPKAGLWCRPIDT